MPPRATDRTKSGVSKTPTDADVRRVLAELKRVSDKSTRQNMAPRYGIVTDKAFGVPMSKMQQVAKWLIREHGGRSHALAAALWKTGWYEARTVAAMVEEPERLTATQMDAWAREFDNWAICDTVCFKLFDQVAPELAFRKVEQWSRRREEFVRRAAFALLACLALHNRSASEANFRRCLPLIESGARDERNFVKKGVSWALRSIARRGGGLREEARKLAERLAASPEAAPRWVGKDALRELTRRG